MWVALVIVVGAVGVLVTLATAMQMMWAVILAPFKKPRIRFEFGMVKQKSGPSLVLDVYNDPLSRWPFSYFNIKRQNIDDFAIVQSHVIGMSSGAMCEIDVALHDAKGQHATNFPLPASPYGLHAALALFDDVGAWVNNSLGIRTLLPPDTYTCLIMFHADEVSVGTMVHRFVVGVDASIFNWIGRPKKLGHQRSTLGMAGGPIS
jgi:hypothetical protein